MGLKKFVKKVGKVAKKVALPLAAAYGGSKLLGAFGATGGASSANSASLNWGAGGAPDSADWSGATLPRVDVSAQSPNWFRENSGALLQGGLSFLGGSMANSANAKQAQKQMDFQEQMSNSSYQRGTADMLAAGLNPMLAYSQGGASSPGGASGSQSDAISPAVSTARAAQQNKLQLEGMALANDNTAAQNDQVKAQTDNVIANTRKTIAETVTPDQFLGQFKARTDQMVADGDLTRAQQQQLLKMSPYQLEAIRLGNTASGYDLAGKKAEHDFWTHVPDAKAAPFISSALQGAKTLKHLFGR